MSSTPAAATRRLHAAAVVLVPGLLICIGVGGGGASAAVVEFPQDLAGFTAAAGAGSSAVTVDFDDLPSGSDIDGQTIRGATFNAIGSPLVVVDASTTASGGAHAQPFNATNALTATGGANILSPGGAVLGPGPDPVVENDDLQLVFAEPVGYVGVDHLSQRADGESFTRVQALSSGGATLIDTIIPISSLPAGEDGVVPGGADFWGIVSDANDIASIIFNEVDEDKSAADNNVGYDSFRFGALADEPAPPPPGVSIPLPPALLTTPLLLCVAEVLRRRIRL